jgi:hypothetical protein
MIFLLLFHTFVAMKKYIFLLAYLILSCFGFSQSNEFKIIPGEGEYFFQMTKYFILKKDLNGIVIDTLVMPEKRGLLQTKFNKKRPLSSISLNNTSLIEKSGEVYVLTIGGGMVWKISNDTAYRVDNSFNHKMTFSSKTFVRNDTIFKFGGYGYWSARNFFTYFSESTKEWEFYSINPRSYLPPGFNEPNTTIINDKLYLTGGTSSRPP